MHVTDSPADPGVLIGQGRAASVYALDDRRVLRRYTKPRSCAGEAELMRYLRQAGYPVPEVLAVDGRDLVLERLNGPDMLADLIRRLADANIRPHEAERVRRLAGLSPPAR
jgi:tRNA A-37 threonylcarbamoyl transferase component Bud32